jgi:SAM-dependent methyltransferase
MPRVAVPWNLGERRHRPEVMDQPGLEETRHVQALRGLERINAWSGSAGILWAPIRGLARETGRKSLRVLDVASGAGDVAVALWRRGRRAGLRLYIDGWDISPRAVAYARARAAAAGADVHFSQEDALAGAPVTAYDVVVSSLFLHHLDEGQAVELLRRMAGAARHLVLVNDLVRCAPGLVLAHLGTRLLSACDVVHTDGPRSVEAAFTPAEARALADRAGLAGARVAWRWPFRFLLTWKRT